MTIDSTLFYLIIAVSVIHSLLVIILNILYLRSVKNLQMVKKQMAQQVEEADRDSAKIVEDARHQARNLIAEATTAAAKVMGDAKLFNKASEDSFNSSLEKATHEYEAQFRQSLSLMQKEVEEMLKTTALEMKKPLVVQLDSFTTTFQKELQTLRVETRRQLEVMQKQTLDEVAVYKEQKLKEAEKTILALSKDVAREIVGAEISQEKHEELVFKALQEAKRQKIV